MESDLQEIQLRRPILHAQNVLAMYALFLISFRMIQLRIKSILTAAADVLLLVNDKY
jgi:hypothetical protein